MEKLVTVQVDDTNGDTFLRGESFGILTQYILNGFTKEMDGAASKASDENAKVAHATPARCR